MKGGERAYIGKVGKNTAGTENEVKNKRRRSGVIVSMREGRMTKKNTGGELERGSSKRRIWRWSQRSLVRNNKQRKGRGLIKKSGGGRGIEGKGKKNRKEKKTYLGRSASKRGGAKKEPWGFRVKKRGIPGGRIIRP